MGWARRARGGEIEGWDHRPNPGGGEGQASTCWCWVGRSIELVRHWDSSMAVMDTTQVRPNKWSLGVALVKEITSRAPNGADAVGRGACESLPHLNGMFRWQ